MRRDVDIYSYGYGSFRDRDRGDSIYSSYGRSRERERRREDEEERLRTEAYRRRKAAGARHSHRGRRALLRRRRRRRRRIRIAVTLGAYLLLLAAAGAGIYGISRGIRAVVQTFSTAEDDGADGTAESAAPQASVPEEKTVQVVLDAGHGGRDQGTSYQDVLEKDINLAVAKKTQELLEQAGCTVQMTRDTDVKIDNYERAAIANRAEAQVFVSVHCNFLESGEADGIEIYYDGGKTESGSLASRILREMIAETGARDRGVKTEDFIVTRETEMASVLIELGYLSDSQERQNLASSAYQEKLAQGIAQGVLSYLGIKI